MTIRRSIPYTGGPSYIGGINSPPLEPADYSNDVNFIYNGTFESAFIGTQGWAPTNSGRVTLARDTVDPMSGTASMKVTLSADNGSDGVQCFLFNFINLADLVGATLTLSFKLRGSGDLMVYLAWAAVPDETLWTGTAGVQQTVSEDFVVPADATRLDLMIVTGWDGSQVGVEYWLDDIKLLKTADAP